MKKKSIPGEINGYNLAYRLRRCRRQYQLTCTEQALFYELIALCNESDWKTWFVCSNGELCNNLNISKNTLILARETLINAGLIQYNSGKSKRHYGQYSFKISSKFDPVAEPDAEPNTLPQTESVTDKKQDTIYKHQIKNKKINSLLDTEILNAYKELDKTVINIHKFLKAHKPNFIDPYIDLWNLFATKYSLIKVETITKKRITNLNKRLKEEKFQFSKILETAKMRDLEKIKEWFTFDWLIKDDTNYIKIFEGHFSLKEEPFGYIRRYDGPIRPRGGTAV